MSVLVKKVSYVIRKNNRQHQLIYFDIDKFDVDVDVSVNVAVAVAIAFKNIVIVPVVVVAVIAQQ